MTDEKDRIIATLNRLANAVVGAIREGRAEDRARLAGELRAMEAGIPGGAGDAAEARAFLSALAGLLEGHPISAEGAEALAGPYAGMYAKIAAKALEAGSGAGEGERDEIKDFLTQIAATVVLVMRKGTEEDRKKLSMQLLEIKGRMPEGQKDASELVLAFTAMLEGRPFDADTLPAPYSGFLRKVMQSIKSGRGKS